MSEVTINPARLRRVGRVLLSRGNSGLLKFDSIGSVVLCVYYDPISKLFFSGNMQKVFPYVFSDNVHQIVEFMFNELSKAFPTDRKFVSEFGQNVMDKHNKQGFVVASDLLNTEGSTSETDALNAINKNWRGFVITDKNHDSHRYTFNFMYPQYMKNVTSGEMPGV